ncbi:GNAT family N-acetyltransferase [Neisseriaceae bacterium TC5R-5]|nr:GNAT family N-acetyltransferase [Neisseriaceae bacterium TC5R-5]
MANWIMWHCHAFDYFTPLTLYQVLQLRDKVFVQEQQSLYGDLDGMDIHCLHLMGHDDTDDLVAYARLLAPGDRYPEAAAIGRIVVAAEARGQGLGQELVAQAITECQRHFANCDIMLSAQLSTVGLYEGFGFKVVSPPYDDGGIEHVDMRRIHPANVDKEAAE